MFNEVEKHLNMKGGFQQNDIKIENNEEGNAEEKKLKKISLRDLLTKATG